MTTPDAIAPVQPANTGDFVASDSDWRGEIERVEDEMRRAFLARDVDSLKHLFAEDLEVNSPLDRIHDRNQVLDLLSRGLIRHLSYDVQIERIRRYGDVVVVMGRDVVTNPPDGAPVHRRFTNVWAPAKGAWRMIARHAHPVTSR